MTPAAEVRADVARRLDACANDVERDRKLQAQVEPYEAGLRELACPPTVDMPAPERERLRWMVEEFRVSLFAQELQTLRRFRPSASTSSCELARREIGASPQAGQRGDEVSA